MDEITQLAGLEPDDDRSLDDAPMFDTPISVLSVAYCGDAYFG